MDLAKTAQVRGGHPRSGASLSPPAKGLGPACSKSTAHHWGHLRATHRRRTTPEPTVCSDVKATRQRTRSFDKVRTTHVGGDTHKGRRLGSEGLRHCPVLRRCPIVGCTRPPHDHSDPAGSALHRRGAEVDLTCPCCRSARDETRRWPPSRTVAAGGQERQDLRFLRAVSAPPRQSA